jgi:hypothetical protein
MNFEEFEELRFVEDVSKQINQLNTVNYRFVVQQIYQPSAFFKPKKINKRFLTSQVTPFEWAITRKHFNMIKLLCLPKYQCNINERFENVSIFQRVFFIYSNDFNLLHQVLDIIFSNLKFDHNLLWDSAKNPLYYLIEQKNLLTYDFVGCLRKHQLYLKNLKNNTNETDLLYYAVIRQKLKKITFLIKDDYPISDNAYNLAKKIK